jgi:hypothetical protein
MDRSDASALADLQMNWDGAYAITFDGHTWCARFYGTTDTLEAQRSSDLRQQVRDDYARRKQAARAGGSTSGDVSAEVTTPPASTGQASTGQARSWPDGLRFSIGDDQVMA